MPSRSAACRLLPLRVVQRQGNVPALGVLQRPGRHRRGGSEGTAEGRAVEAGERQVHHHAAEPGHAERIGRVGAAPGGHHVMSRGSQRRRTAARGARRPSSRPAGGGAPFREKLSAPPEGARTVSFTVRMTDLTDLAELVPGQRVQDPLLILDVERRGGDTPHTVLTFQNASGRLPSAPFWLEDQPKIAGLAPGDVAQVIGEVALYRGQRQLEGVVHPPAAEGERGAEPAGAVGRRHRALLEDARRLARRNHPPAAGRHARTCSTATTTSACATKRAPRAWAATTPCWAGCSSTRSRWRASRAPSRGSAARRPTWCWRGCCCTTSASWRRTAGKAGSSRAPTPARCTGTSRWAR